MPIKSEEGEDYSSEYPLFFRETRCDLVLQHGWITAELSEERSKKWGNLDRDVPRLKKGQVPTTARAWQEISLPQCFEPLHKALQVFYFYIIFWKLSVYYRRWVRGRCHFHYSVTVLWNKVQTSIFPTVTALPLIFVLG